MRVILPHLQCELTQEEFIQGVGAEFSEKFIVCPDGKIFKRIDYPNGLYCQYQVESIPVKGQKSMPKMGEEIHFLPAGKVPVTLYHQIVDFFQKVMSEMGGDKLVNRSSHGALEAMAHIVWNPSQDKTRYQVRIPTQRVSAASVSYEWDHLEEGDQIIVDIHSHNNMGAFFSGTDDNDDKKNTCYSGVVGKLGSATPETCWRFNDLDKKKFSVKFEDVFQQESVSCPKEWLDKVTKMGYYGGNLYGGAYGGGRNRGGNRHFPQGGGGRNQSTRGNTNGNVIPLGGPDVAPHHLSYDDDDDWGAAFGVPPAHTSQLDLELQEQFGSAYPGVEGYDDSASDKEIIAASSNMLEDPVLQAIMDRRLDMKDFARIIPRFIKVPSSKTFWEDKYSEDEDGNTVQVTKERMEELIEESGEYMMYIPYVDTYIISADIEKNTSADELLDIYLSTLDVDIGDDDLDDEPGLEDHPFLQGPVDAITISELMEFLKNGTTYMDQLIIVAYLQQISSNGKLDELLKEAGLSSETGEISNAELH